MGLPNTLASVLGFKDKLFPAKLYDKLFLADGVTPDPTQYFSASQSNVISISSFVNSSKLEVTRQSHGLLTGDRISIDNWPTEHSVGGIFPNKIDSLTTNITYDVTKYQMINLYLIVVILQIYSKLKNLMGNCKKREMYIYH